MPMSDYLHQLREKVGHDLLLLPSTAVALFDIDGRVLLGKHSDRNIWVLPGGLIEPGEVPADAAVREVWEETSLGVEIERLLFVKTWTPDRVGIYYLCQIKDGELHPSDEVSEFGFFSLDDLPDVRPLDVGLIKQLYEMAEHELA